MSKTTLGFILTGLAYLTLGTTLGVLFLVLPDLRPLRTVHAHLNLVGFMTFFVFGIAYHILPRFRGRPLYSESMAWLQLWLANVGLVGLMVLMGIGAFADLAGLMALTAAFGAALAVSIYLFVYNLGKTIFGGAPKEQ
ncbi:MAG: cbb3-type cytochrome c oxidase subunit I [Chloroflexi bacterium]|nr:cbb3-type cytochrome c oxidase subunit I [Chloroflexota bacterium]